MSRTNDEYFAHYNNLQHVKHELVRNYLNGWLPILASWNGRILYVDTHAGRGRHTGGQAGSPIVAIQTLLSHHFRDRILSRCEVAFNLIENDPENYERLKKELVDLGPLPPKVVVHHACDDSLALLKHTVGELRQQGKKLAPAFLFLDPYGFHLPGALLRDLMSFARVELFVNVIGRELDMAIENERGRAQRTRMADTLDSVFDGPTWRTIVGDTPDLRLTQVMALFESLVGAKWSTYVRMRQGGEAAKYLLLHLTNHDRGRDLMKDTIWKVLPAGDYCAYQTEDWQTGILIGGEPDHGTLDRWVLDRLARGPARWTTDLHAAFLGTPFRAVHLNETMRRLRHAGHIRHEGGRFLPKDDPVLVLR